MARDAGPDTAMDSPPPPRDVSIDEAAPDSSPDPDANACSVSVDAGPPFDPEAAAYAHFCDLPGSVRFTGGAGTVTVPGGTGAANLQFLRLPVGFCAHYFGNLAALTQSVQAGGNVRQLRFAPNGDLFVASPTNGTTGGGGGGLAAILVLPDDNGDGLADTAIRFATGLPTTQGLMFTNAGDYFYYPDGTRILRLPYPSCNRRPS